MIVRNLDDGSTILVNQTDHAKLSGFFAAHWGNAAFCKPTPRESCVRGAMFHDNGWHRYETGPSFDPVEKMSPSFFQSPVTDTQLAAFGDAIDWLSDIDPYAGLMISRHRTGLYRGRYGAVQQPSGPTRGRQDPRIDAFVARYEAKQADTLKSFSEAEFLVNYQLLQFWDLLSLSLCMRDPREEVFEFTPTDYRGDGKSGVRMTMTPLESGEIKLDPFPFDQRPLSLAYAYRHLPTRDYEDEAAFRDAYFGAKPLLKTFAFV